MNKIIDIEERPGPTFAQRWNSYLAIAMAAAVLLVGITLRDNTLNATQTFENLEAGVRAQVPRGWLLDTQSSEYVFRAEDPDALPFKTVLQVSVLPVGPDATPNLVLDILNMQRAPRFSTYREISRTDQTLRGEPAKRMTYAYTQDERNPFQATLPVVVQGVDVVVLRRGQAVIITYREERSAFEDHLYRFENLLRTVEIF
ncbi:MAG TPA: hypothetical protein VMT24_19670 [Aggregatilineaceae bacterium]|nr:hypothetical protein [Aggregatilineaceae bacterium]